MSSPKTESIIKTVDTALLRSSQTQLELIKNLKDIRQLLKEADEIFKGMQDRAESDTPRRVDSYVGVSSPQEASTKVHRQ